MSRFVLPTVGADEYRSAVDAGREELRVAPLELRDVSGLTLAGRAIVFGQPSVDMGGWDEVIQRGATRKVLATKPDTRLLINHDGIPLARTTAGTLTLRESPEGLDWTATLRDGEMSRELIAAVERGDLSQMSFAFRVAAGGATWAELDGGRERRTVTELASLPEISIVTFPAYEPTSVTTSRSAEDAHSQEVADDRDESATGAVDVRDTDLGAAPDDAGVIQPTPALAPEWIAAKRRRIDRALRG